MCLTWFVNNFIKKEFNVNIYVEKGSISAKVVDVVVPSEISEDNAFKTIIKKGRQYKRNISFNDDYKFYNISVKNSTGNNVNYILDTVETEDADGNIIYSYILTVDNVKSDIDIYVSSILKSSPNIIVGENMSVSPNTYEIGKQQTFTITADDGYYLYTNEYSARYSGDEDKYISSPPLGNMTYYDGTEFVKSVDFTIQSSLDDYNQPHPQSDLIISMPAIEIATYNISASAENMSIKYNGIDVTKNQTSVFSGQKIILECQTNNGYYVSNLSYTNGDVETKYYNNTEEPKQETSFTIELTVDGNVYINAQTRNDVSNVSVTLGENVLSVGPFTANTTKAIYNAEISWPLTFSTDYAFGSISGSHDNESLTMENNINNYNTFNINLTSDLDLHITAKLATVIINFNCNGAKMYEFPYADQNDYTVGDQKSQGSYDIKNALWKDIRSASGRSMILYAYVDEGRVLDLENTKYSIDGANMGTIEYDAANGFNIFASGNIIDIYVETKADGTIVYEKTITAEDQNLIVDPLSYNPTDEQFNIKVTAKDGYYIVDEHEIQGYFKEVDDNGDVLNWLGTKTGGETYENSTLYKSMTFTIPQASGNLILISDQIRTETLSTSTITINNNNTVVKINDNEINGSINIYNGSTINVSVEPIDGYLINNCQYTQNDEIIYLYNDNSKPSTETLSFEIQVSGNIEINASARNDYSTLSIWKDDNIVSIGGYTEKENTILMFNGDVSMPIVYKDGYTFGSIQGENMSVENNIENYNTFNATITKDTTVIIEAWPVDVTVHFSCDEYSTMYLYKYDNGTYTPLSTADHTGSYVVYNALWKDVNEVTQKTRMFAPTVDNNRVVDYIRYKMWNTGEWVTITDGVELVDGPQNVIATANDIYFEVVTKEVEPEFQIESQDVYVETSNSMDATVSAIFTDGQLNSFSNAYISNPVTLSYDNSYRGSITIKNAMNNTEYIDSPFDENATIIPWNDVDFTNMNMFVKVENASYDNIKVRTYFDSTGSGYVTSTNSDGIYEIEIPSNITNNEELWTAITSGNFRISIEQA